jgi:hypothetical protein
VAAVLRRCIAVYLVERLARQSAWRQEEGVRAEYTFMAQALPQVPAVLPCWELLDLLVVSAHTITPVTVAAAAVPAW